MSRGFVTAGPGASHPGLGKLTRLMAAERFVLIDAKHNQLGRGVQMNSEVCITQTISYPIDFKRAYMRRHAPDDAEILHLLSKGGNEPLRDGDELPPGVAIEQAIRGSVWASELGTQGPDQSNGKPL